MAITLVRNIGLDDTASSTRTSNICEPTAAANNRQLMKTGNWFASTSTDTGANWTYVDPFTRFPASAGGFCCDQVVQFNPRHRIWIWLLQYISTAANENIFRLAVCRETAFGSWYYWDFAPRNLNAAWTGVWFDYPDMAFSNDNLFVTFNVFSGSGSSASWVRAVVFRFPLATLAAGTSLGYHWWTTTANGSLRLTRGAGATMYFGSHNTLSQIRVFQWPDSGTSVSSANVNVRAWSQGSYSAPGPGNVNWLARVDGRITGAWVAANVIGFMWSANRDANHPLPFIRVVRLNEGSKALIDEPDIWSSQSAWAYPAAAPNANGQAGMSAFYGGGTRHPSHVVGARTATAWDTVITRASTHGPANGAWGDYLSCIAHHQTATNWVASGYTLQGGSDRRSVEPRYVEFRV
jgi:hypothetical protein